MQMLQQVQRVWVLYLENHGVLQLILVAYLSLCDVEPVQIKVELSFFNHHPTFLLAAFLYLCLVL